MTHREARYVSLRLQGISKKDAALKCVFTIWQAKSPSWIETPEMLEALAEMQGELVENALNAGLIDAAEIHDYLTEAIRADMRDIRNNDGSFKPQSEWPEIWGRMMEAGDCEIETLSERSHDGSTKYKAGGWDVAGTVTKVKLKFSSRVKMIELAMKHKAVNAMVEQKAGDTNILVITADKARQVASARKRLEKMLPAADAEIVE